MTVRLCMLLLAAPVAVQAQTSLTIYADGRVLVRRTINTPVPRGASTHAVDLGVREADPGSITALDEGVEVRATRVAGATGVEGSLRRALGQDVEFRAGPDTAPRYLRATLLSLEPPTVRVDGRVLYGLPGQPVFPDSLVQLTPRVELEVEAARAQQALRLMFMTAGLSWQASYTIVLPRGGRGEAAVTGTATIQNGGALAFPGAEVQLLAGDVRAAPRVQRGPVMAAMRAREVASEADAAGEESVGETHLYTLSGAVDIAPGLTRTAALFPRATAATEPEFALRDQAHWAMNELADTLRDLHPEIAYRVRRAATTPFGRVPLPGGAARVYQPDSAGRPQLVGEAAIGHTAAGSDLRLVTGTAFDITGTRVQSSFRRISQREAESSYRVELRNARREAVTVLVQDEFPGAWVLVDSSLPADQRTGRLLGFRVAVPAAGETVLEYRVRVRW